MSKSALCISDKSSEAVSEASILLRRVTPVGGSVKAAIAAAARRFGWNYNRTRDLWYAHARRVDAAEIDALRAAAHEEAAYLDRLCSLRNSLLVADPEMYGADADALAFLLTRCRPKH